MFLTKLDTYDVIVLPGLIRVELEGRNDAQATDILSEISRTDNMLYLNSHYYEFLGHSEIVEEEEGYVFLDLHVVECDRRMIL